MQRDREPRADDDEPPHRIEDAGHQHDRAGEHFGHRQAQGRRAPEQLHALVQEQDDAEGRDHLVEMVAVIEVAEDRELEDEPEQQRGAKREHQREQEIAGEAVEHHGEIGAEHVLHAMRQVDEVHHAEHQRQPCGDQEQQHAELQAVQGLDDEEGDGHGDLFIPPPQRGGWLRRRSERGRRVGCFDRDAHPTRPRFARVPPSPQAGEGSGTALTSSRNPWRAGRSSSRTPSARSRSGTCRRRAWRPSPDRSPGPDSCWC